MGFWWPRFPSGWAILEQLFSRLQSENRLSKTIWDLLRRRRHLRNLWFYHPSEAALHAEARLQGLPKAQQLIKDFFNGKEPHRLQALHSRRLPQLLHQQIDVFSN